MAHYKIVKQENYVFRVVLVDGYYDRVVFYYWPWEDRGLIGYQHLDMNGLYAFLESQGESLMARALLGAV